MELERKKKNRMWKSLHQFIWGPEVELGDCIFYTILTEILLALIWLFTFERVGIHVWYSLIVWAGIVFLIWREYLKYHPKGKGTQSGLSNS